jgi:short-subunit dehydrogenase
MPSATIITGASSGIGRELALLLAEEGATLYLLGQNPERVSEVADLVEARGGTAHPHVCDLTNFEATEAWYREVVGQGVVIEALYHCVGRNTFGEVADLLMDDLEWVYQTNLLTAAQWVSLVYPDMAKRGGGTLVLLSSLSAYAGFPMATPYAASKQAMLALGYSIWPEAAEVGVNFHIACPGFVQTRIFEASRFRDCDLAGVMQCIRKLGFPIMSADKAARRLLKDVRRGKRLIIFPLYAKLMAFLGRRMPWFIDIFHRRVIRMLAEKSTTPQPHGDA